MGVLSQRALRHGGAFCGLALAWALAACSATPVAGDAGTDASAADASTDAADVGTADAAARSPHAAWPMPNVPASGLPTPQRFEVLSTGRVRDAVTGLVWAREAGDALRTRDEAAADCDALTVDGQSDFRLPTRIEWVSLLDPSRSPAIDGAAFPGTAAEYHWTSSSSAAFAGSAYSVYLGGGETTLGIASRASALVRCVTEGAMLDGDPYVIEGEHVRDRGTGLLWARASVAEASWADATAACAPGRLPSLRELQTIVDESRTEPAIDRAAFPDTSATRYWASTVRDAGELLPWTVDFADGQTFSDEPASARHPARCLVE